MYIIKHLILSVFLLLTSFVSIAQFISDGNDLYHTSGKVGIGINEPTVKLHIQYANTGVKTQYSSFVLEDIDSQMDIISNSTGLWGSAINLIEGNGSTNTDIWSIARETTGGSGNSSLRFNFGSKNRHNNSTKVTFDKNGNVGIGINEPTVKFHIRNLNTGVKSQYSSFILEDEDSQMDIISNSSGSWGSSINLVEGNGDTNTDIWSIARETTGGTGNSSLKFNFGSKNRHSNSTKVTFDKNGNVGIGTTETQGYKLAVNGNIRAKEVKVESGWADFVFEKDYQLMTLSELDDYIKTNKHLPEIPTAKEVQENGIGLSEINTKFLQKIEELTLYTISQQELIEEQKKLISDQKSDYQKLEEKYNDLEQKVDLLIKEINK